MLLTSSCLIILMAVALAVSAFTNPPLTKQHGIIRFTAYKNDHKTPTALSMGAFDWLNKAFSNEVYGDAPETIKATARHILLPTLDNANMVLEELNTGDEGVSFATLANKYSTCPSGKDRGGSLGSFKPGTMVKEFDDVVFAPSTRLGTIYGPVQTKFGYHLIVVDKRSGGSDWY